MLEPTPPTHRLSRCPDISPEASKPSLRSLFESEEAGLLWYAFSLTGRRAIAEEIVQEVFLQLHAHWANVDTPRAWLYRSVRNRAFHWGRRRSHEPLSGNESLPELAVDDCEPPDVMLLKMEELAALRQRLCELTEKDRQLVELKYFEQLKYREISERTGLTIGNVGFRLHKILLRLAQELRSRDFD